MAGGNNGAIDVLNWAVTQMTSDVGTAIAAVLARDSDPFTMSAPDAVNGLSKSPTSLRRDRHNQIQLWVEADEEVAPLMSVNSAYYNRVVIGAIWIVSDKDQQVLEMKKLYAVQAMKDVIRQNWRQSGTGCYQVKFLRVNYRTESMRNEGGSRGGLIGQQATPRELNLDAAVCGFEFRQKVPDISY